MTLNETEIADLQSAKGKSYKLVFLPYLETLDGKPVIEIIGYEPAWVRRGYGYGRWEEFFHTLQAAETRMKFLIDSNVIEACELRQAIPNAGMCTKLLSEWNEP